MDWWIVPLAGGVVKPMRVTRPVGPCLDRVGCAPGGVSESPDGTLGPVQSEWQCSSGLLRRSSCRARACSFGVASPAPGIRPGGRPEGESLQRVVRRARQWRAGVG